MTFHSVYIYLLLYFYQLFDILNLTNLLQNIVLIKVAFVHIISCHLTAISISIY